MPSYFERLVSTFQEQLHASQSRSDILRALAWIMAILLAATLLSFSISTPTWFSVLLATFLAVTMAVYLFAYVYCLFRDRDALRSETYTLHKMAIERGFLGDDVSGLVDPKNLTTTLGPGASPRLSGPRQ